MFNNLYFLLTDLRPAQHIENMLSICKSMYAAFANLSESVPQANQSGIVTSAAISSFSLFFKYLF